MYFPHITNKCTNVTPKYIHIKGNGNKVQSRSTKLTAMKYTGCPRRNVPDFGRVFLMLKYADITLNTYVQI